MGINITRPFAMPEKPTVSPPILNLKDITQKLKDILTKELKDQLPDFQGDLAMLANEIAPVLVSAVAAGDTKLKKELVAQLEAIGEIYNIRSNAAMWRTAKSVFGLVLEVLSVGVGAAVARI